MVWGLLVKVDDGFADDPKPSLKLHIPTESENWWIRLSYVIDIELFET